MKKQIKSMILAGLLSAGALSSFGQAEIQIIHNAADPAAATVDVYVNGALALDDFAFRSATPFISLPSATLLNIGVAPGSSTSVNDTLKNFEVTLMTGQRYIAVANGVLNPANFDANPDGASTAFTLFLQDQMQEVATGSDVDFRAIHGASDAPTVDVIARNVATLVNDASYGAITGYLSVPAASYILDVTPAAGSPIVASFTADLSTLGGGSAVVFASGFLNPATNQNGAAFGLFAALANGTVVTLPGVSTARLQVIHNAADPAAAVVDVYVNGNILLDDFAFRTATPFVDVPAGVLLNIGVAAGNSTSVNDTLKNFEVTLANGGSYLAVANGVLNPANFDANPDGASTAFTLFLQDQMQEVATGSDVDFRAIHGASDAPTVDVIARNVATLVNDASYGAITGYLSVPAASYILDVTPAAGSPIVASFTADLSTLGGGSAVVFASGFLNPATNQNGAAFGLFAALANGTVVTLPGVSTARLQVIHNAADPAAAVVDVYVNGNILLDDFAFRTATPFVDVPADVLLNIGVAAGNSTSVNDTLKNFEVTLANGGSYLAVANGVLNPANFDANPDGASTAFTLFLQDQMQEAATGSDVDFRAIHGASDAPTVDVIARNVATLVNDASYGAITGYLSVPAASYILDVTPAAGSPIVASFTADLSTLGGGSAVVFASGFLNPATNQNGAAFGLFAALANGTVVTLPGVSTARLQVIHNAADPAAAVVDVYVNGNILLDDFAFRTATPFVDVPADVLLNIGVAAGNSTSVNDTLKNFEVTLANGGSYLAVANGVLNPANFDANPDGASTAFTLFLQDQMQEAATGSDVDFRAIHGASDAPTVDVIARNVATLVNDASYGVITGYLSVPAASYILDVTPAAGSPIVASFTADLSTLGGGSAVVFASGFLNPATNQNGAAFGLFAALANGTVVTLPGVSTARLQVIHNAADPAAAVVDVYVNGNILLDDFAFRTATPFVDVPADVLLNIGVAAGNSTSVNDTLKNFEVTLANGGSYLAVANGVLNPANFDANPDGASTAFTLFLQDQMQEVATGSDVDFRAIHGASDAPTVDVIARNVATLVNDASYGAITGYLSVPAASYILDVTPAAGSPIVASFTADLSTLGGGSAVVFASGFLNPATNQNGAAFGLFAALANGTVVTLPGVSTARLQVIHNAADPAAAVVDVYVNGNILLDDFAFRTATPFVDVPADVLLNIGVAAGNSTSVNDTLKNFEVTLANGGSYLAVANGVLNPANFDANPDGASTAFTLFLQDQMQEAATGSDVDFRAIHGASDAPTVDVIARNVATLVNDASYGAITGYLSVPAASYILDVTPAAGSPIVASFTADLSTLGGGSAVVFASGFLNPATNQNGAAFGLFAALANGTVVTLPGVSTARLQVIHNAADPAAAVVDVYVNGNILLDDFAFRTATPFVDVPADVLLNIGVAAGNSTSVNDTLKNFEVTLANGGSYLAVANGVLNPANFDANPDGASTAFTLFLQDQMQEAATGSDVDFRAIHGASDAPTVDVIARNVATLVNDASYGAITGYLSVPAASYILDVTPAAGSPIVASFTADLSTLGGGSAVVFASGFLNPATNQNGAAFGLFAALANGTVVTLPGVSTARLQVIHNAADPAAAVVDVYVNGNILLDDFAFRTATPFVDVPAGVLLNIGVAAGNSTSVNDTLKNFEVTLANGGSYLAVANGVLNPANFDANPDGASTAFTLFLQDQMQEVATGSDVDFRVIHGASDAPTVDVVVGGNVLVDNAAYSNITPYLSVPAASYQLDITPGNNNSVIVASFIAPLTSLGGQSAVILASGFLNPATNQNGAAFGLIAVLADGTVIILGNVTSIDENSNVSNFTMYPNPATDVIQINPINGSVKSTVEITNHLGQIVKTNQLNGTTLSIPLYDLSKGVYFVKVQNENGRTVSKLVVE